MINTFFIADTHFGHKNIIGYNRPQFANLQEMHDCMVDRWNAVVRPKDIVWVLGDVAFGRDWVTIMMPQLNGTKHLILGNHDTYGLETYAREFKKILGVIAYKNCLLTHIPVHPKQTGRFKLNIHGHVHHVDADLAANPFYYNVCADHINLTPVAWETIRERIK